MFFRSQQIGISTNIFINPSDVVGTVALLSNNFQNIEIEIEGEARVLYDKDAGAFSEIISGLNHLKEERNLYYTVHAPYIGAACDIAAKDDAARTAAVDYTLRCLDFCQSIGAAKMTYHPGLLETGQKAFMPQVDRLIQSARRISAHARSLGIMPCLENMGDGRPKFLLLNHDQHEAVCRQTGTKLTIDLIHHASLIPAGEGGFDDLYYELFFSTLKRIMPHVGHFHLADISGVQHAHLPLGTGELDVTRVLAFIASNGYDGPVIVEERGGGHSAEAFVEHARLFRDSMNVTLAA
jgi:sugar phosphate isomerase/epimerase